MRFDESEIDSFLSVGDVVMVHLDPAKKWEVRYKTCVRGWHKPHHIILDRPRSKGLLVRLSEGFPCVVRLLSGGKAVGFASRVLDWDSPGAHPYCRVAWPEQLQVVSFRQHERINLFVPCTITVGDTTHDGQVQNLSVDGCRVHAHAEIEEGSPVELSFTMPDGLPVECVRAEVRNVQPRPDGALFGCHVTPGQEHVQSDMAFYIAAMLNRSQAGHEATPRLLIVANDPQNTKALSGTFERHGWDTFVASTSFEGLLRLRMVFPSALLVSQEQEDLGCLEMLRLLKSTRGLEALPVFLYGRDAEIKQQARDAGSAGHFPLPLNLGRVFDIISAAASKKAATEDAPTKDAATEDAATETAAADEAEEE